MKKLVLIIIVFIANMGLAQDLNEKVLQFVNSNIGNKVGDGVCNTLVLKALEEAKGEKVGKVRVSPFRHEYRADYGKKISYKKVKPGDIVMYKDIPHIGIVTKINESVMETAEQNVLLPKQTTKKHSKVVLRNHHYDEKRILRDYFVFYRPN